MYFACTHTTLSTTWIRPEIKEVIPDSLCDSRIFCGDVRCCDYRGRASIHRRRYRLSCSTPTGFSTKSCSESSSRGSSSRSCEITSLLNLFI